MKQDFPLLDSDIAYLDSASTTQKPRAVIDAITHYYTTYNANIHRGMYALSIKSTELYEQSRKTIAEFIGAQPREIVFTSGTTEGLNLLANSIHHQFGERREIVLTQLEHHANLIPWQELAKEHGLTLKFINITPQHELDYDQAEQLIGKNTALVSFTHMSNAIGTSIDAKRICSLAKSAGALSIIDAAQSIAHQRIDVKDLDCDFLVFSGHKIYGPTGTGVLYGRYDRLNRLRPLRYGGDMIKEVTFEEATYLEAPHKFEGGTPHIAGVYALGKAIEFYTSLSSQTRRALETVHPYLRDKLGKNDRVKIYSPDSSKSIISFTLDGVHTHDVADILGQEGVCIRAGHHCAEPLMHVLGVNGLCRVSLGIYNTTADVDKLILALNKVTEVFT